ncbi:MAG: redoxin domain-containing protein [Thermoanaerobaculia bacterium]
MSDFIGNHIQFIVAWGQWISGGVVVLGLYLIYRIVRGNRFFLPKGILAWLGCLLLVPVILLGAAVCARITVIKPKAVAILERLDAIKGETAPALGYRLVATGEPEELDSLRGKVVLLNFWATWCAPCRKEMPELDRLQRELADDLVVLTISDEPREALVAYQEESGFAMRSGYLEDFPWVNMGSERPVTFLIDRSGVVRDFFTGPWDFEFFAGAIEPYL